MFKSIIVGFFGIFTLGVFAQTPYEDGMKKAFALWEQENLLEAANIFQRIASVEKENWLPSFYAGYLLILTSFDEKDEATLQLQLDKAEALLNAAEKNSPNNAEIILAKALRHTAFINFDGKKYGMSLSMKNNQLYQTALQLAPQNPRVVLSKAEWDMGTARFFNQSTEPYCKDVERAIALFKTEKDNPEKFYPRWGLERAEAILKNCQP